MAFSPRYSSPRWGPKGTFLGAITGFLRGVAQLIFVVGIIVAIVGGGAVALAIAHFSRDLPDHQQLLTYQPATGSRVYAGDGTYMAEFATEHRTIIPIKEIPQLVVQCFSRRRGPRLLQP